MTEWVLNNVRCDKMDEIKERYKGCPCRPAFSFNSVVPLPEGADEIPYGPVPYWGTKWDADEARFSTIDREEILIFFSAYATPRPVFQAMAQQLGCDVYVEYADEDFGRNCGWTTYHPDGSFENEDGDFGFAEDLWNASEDDEEDE